MANYQSGTVKGEESKAVKCRIKQTSESNQGLHIQADCLSACKVYLEEKWKYKVP